MSYKFDCQKLDHNEDKAHCSVCGWIYDCPTECSEYVDYFGRKPNEHKGDFPLCQ